MFNPDGPDDFASFRTWRFLDMSELRTVKLGIIGLGARGKTLLESIFGIPGIEVAGCCDVRAERVKEYLEIFDKNNRTRPKAYETPQAMIADPEIEAILAPTSWNSHLKIARQALKAGKYVGIEVGGASSLHELWELVSAAEESSGQCMLMENCCYARNELMVMNMVRKGLFGELIYCECGYEHDLEDLLASDYQNGNERAVHNIHRRGDLYPTHGIGPIAKILNINRGNRFLSLTSHATKGRALSLALKNYLGITDVQCNQADITTTVISCANGENITVTHGITLPRPYSRDCRVQGTKGIWLENGNSIYIEGISPKETKIDFAGNPYLSHDWNKVEDFYEQYDHPIWQKYRDEVIGGHGGMDMLILLAFADAVRRKAPTPIDVYDCASWMAVTCLSEQSVAMGGMPVPFPDFTDGKWVERTVAEQTEWSL